MNRILVHDWAPNDAEGDELLFVFVFVFVFVFDCGKLGADEQRIQLDDNELDRWDWVEVARLAEYVIPRLARRLFQAHRAWSEGRALYLEHGEPVPIARSAE